MIVDADADLDAAADAAVWGGMSNAGQTCVGVERVYVAEAVYDAFLGELVGARPRAAARRRPTRLRPDDHARPARRRPPAHRRRAGPGRPAVVGGPDVGAARRTSTR